MLFNSITFIFFLAIVLALHYSPLSWSAKKTNLLIASYLFYAAWNPYFVLLLLMSTLLDWKVAARIYASVNPRERKFWLVISLLVNLGALAFFKYTNFLMANLVVVAETAGISFAWQENSIVLPMGISFYTFQTISYSMDVYRGKMKPWNSLKDYALYVSFFPQLVAGPIVRSNEFLPQCVEPKQFDGKGFSVGLALLLIGLMEKVFLADSVFAPLVDSVFQTEQVPDAMSAWAASYFFTMQIFCDFAGYSLCAIGTAKCLGFRLPFNFNSPMAATGFSDYWTRWHISLSTWLRDYLYFSLGGNRLGRSKTLRNLMLTMALGGLWHGAKWPVILWGIYHGVLLVSERIVQGRISFPERLPEVLRTFLLRLMMMFFIVISFTIFRSESIGQVGSLIAVMFGLTDSEVTVLSWDMTFQIAILASLALITVQWIWNRKQIIKVIENSNFLLRGLGLAACVILIVLSTGQSDGFIYFQF
jgi:alginate O-acetyltransferase complex protein AlgI